MLWIDRVKIIGDGNAKNSFQGERQIQLNNIFSAVSLIGHKLSCGNLQTSKTWLRTCLLFEED